MLSVLNSGITLIQDSGRPHYTSVGVPTSGAFNSAYYWLACELIDEENVPLFEILGGRFSISSTKEILIAVVGEAKVSSGVINANFLLEANKTLAIEPIGSAPVYVAVSGLVVEKTLGSASFDTLSGLGPKPVASGDIFEVVTSAKSSVGSFLTNLPAASNTIHYIQGPQEINLEDSYEIASVSRSGVRLTGQSNRGAGNLKSFPVLPGSIQIPPSGEPVILGVDCGVTGGYPVAGVVITADLHLLSMLRQDTRVHLKRVDLEGAKKLNSDYMRRLESSVVRTSGLGFW